MPKEKTNGSRVGLHKRGSARMQFFVEPEEKALAALVGEVIGAKNLTDAMIECFKRVAESKGIIDNAGNIIPEYKNRFQLKLYDIKLTK